MEGTFKREVRNPRSPEGMNLDFQKVRSPNTSPIDRDDCLRVKNSDVERLIAISVLIAKGSRRKQSVSREKWLFAFLFLSILGNLRRFLDARRHWISGRFKGKVCRSEAATFSSNASTLLISNYSGHPEWVATYYRHFWLREKHPYRPQTAYQGPYRARKIDRKESSSSHEICVLCKDSNWPLRTKGQASLQDFPDFLQNRPISLHLPKQTGWNIFHSISYHRRSGILFRMFESYSITNPLKSHTHALGNISSSPRQGQGEEHYVLRQ